MTCHADIWEADPGARASKPKQAEPQPTGLAQCRDEEFQLYAGSTFSNMSDAADGCEISFQHLLCYYLDPYADLFGESMALPQVFLPCIGRADSAPC